MDSKDTLIQLRRKTGMNKKQFAEYFGIPYRTLQDWELGNRRMPDYLLRLMIYKVEMERLGEPGRRGIFWKEEAAKKEGSAGASETESV